MTSLLPPPEIVSIPDANLAGAVREILGLASSNTLTSHTMLELVILDIRDFQITDLTGFEHAISLSKLSLSGNSLSDISPVAGLTNLTELYLGSNSVSDISALGGLTNLTTLYLDSNSVSDISALGGLTNLTRLYLYDNSISDLSALAGLTNLTYLNLDTNSVSDLSALAGLTNLTELYLGSNPILDISPVAGLTNLTWLSLGGNHSVRDISALESLTNLTGLNLSGNLISDLSALAGLANLIELYLNSNSVSDLSPLVANTGLGRGDTINVRWNPLGYASINTHIPTLQSRGITVEFDNQTATSLVKISGDQHGSPATPLSHPFVVEVRDERRVPFEGVPVTFAIIGGDGTLSVTQTTTNTDGKAESTLTLGPNLGPYTVSVSAAGVEQPVTFTAVAGEGVTIPDSNLQAAIRTALGAAADVQIVPSKLATLTYLEARNATIGHLTGLEFATNLRYLNLNGNSVSDLSPVAGLTNLTTLNLNDNSVSDLSPVADLTNLRTLNLNGNSVSDLSGVSDLTNLTTLNLNDNSVSDLSPVADLTNLRTLNLNGNSVSDIPGVSGLTNLTTLNLGSNSVSDLSGVSDLTNLTTLHLGGNNSVSDLSPMVGLTNLTWLSLGENSISDISALAGLTNLTTLHLGGNNSVSDLSPVAGLTNLTWLHLGSNSVSDISALAGLTNLTWLSLGGNNSLSNISALAGLTNLTYLSLYGNSASDISPVAGLTNLTMLDLWSNSVSDISALAANTGLGSGDTVDVRWNPLSHASINTHIPTLQGRGVTVWFDAQAQPALLKISGDNQKGASFAPLSRPFIVEVQYTDGSALAGIWVRFAVTAGGGTLSTTITRTDANGRAQSTLTLGPNLGTNTVEVSAAGIASKITFYAICDTESPPMTADVNNDGVVNILDLVLISSRFGQSGQNDADVNGDGVVSILDLVLVAGMFEGAAAAPSTQTQVPETLTAVEVQGWLTDAISLEVKNVTIKRGVMVLEQLLISLTPKETELLANYPNPFNPETWIPYRLAEDAFVTLTIYDATGQIVRTIEVGHRIAAAYESQPKAIHWDGKNDLGEGVASGIYFYTLSAGDYSATRKMVILK